MSRKLVHYLCILLLLFAQQAAYTHAAWHAGEQGERHDRPHDTSFDAKLCDLHGAFAQVLGALPGSPTSLPDVPPCDEQVSVPAAACVVPPVPVPTSRGPPTVS